MTTHQTWQDNLDPKLIQRLLRPVVQPGIIGTQMARVIISISQNFSNRLPLLSQIAQRQPSVAGFQAEQTPIVYAQPLSRETRTASSTPVQKDLQNSQAGKPTVIQAKLAHPFVSTSIAGTAKKLVFTTLQTPTKLNPLSRLIPPNPDSTPAGFQTGQTPIVYAQPLLDEVSNSGVLDSPFLTIAPETNLLNSQSPNSLTSEVTNQTNTTTAAVSPVWLNNRQLPTHEILTNITSKIPRSVVQETQTRRAEINTPLLFSLPNAIAARKLGNQGTTDIPRTQYINRNAAPTISSEITANSTNSVANNSQTTANNQTANMSPNRAEERVQKIDIDALADKVERKLIRKLIIENERRGRTTWS